MLRTPILRVALVLTIATTTFSAEGVLPIRAGDRVSGDIRWCGDRHVLAIELVRGETFKAKVRVGKTLAEDVTVRFYDPTGLSQNSENVRSRGSVARVGPFRATVSGTHILQITTFTRHEIPYDVTTKVRSRKRRALRLAAGRQRSIVAPAGAVLRVRGLRDGGTIALGLPGKAIRELDADGARLAALRGDGLTLPEGGTYTLSAPEGAGRPRITVRAPRTGTRREVRFPELPDDRGAVAMWYDDTGWVADPRLAAPADHEPPVSAANPGAPDPGPIAGRSLLELPTAPATANARSVFAAPSLLSGHAPGLGMPIAPIPTIEQALAEGRVEAYGDGPSYVFDARLEGLGLVTYRVQFVVGGRTTPAPVEMSGRAAMRWWIEGSAAFHEESWTLTVDTTRGVEVLDGSATYIGPNFETVQSAASGYAFPTDDRAPSGTLSWGVQSPRNGPFLRTETHDGRGGIAVEQTPRDGRN